MKGKTQRMEENYQNDDTNINDDYYSDEAEPVKVP